MTLLAFLGATSLRAQSPYVWQGTGSTTTPTTGSWNTSSNWSGGTPTSAATTELDFNASSNNASGGTPGRYTSTDNISGAFQLNILALNSSAGAAVGDNQTIAASSSSDYLEFVANGGTNPTLNINNTGNFVISANIDLAANLTIGGTTSSATTTLYLNGAIDDSGSLTVANNNYTVILGSTNTYSGGTIFNGALISSYAAGAMGSGPITMTGSGGKWTITSVNQSYTNNITLNAATIEGDTTDTLSGSITDSGTLTLRQTATGSTVVGTISNTISGAGNLVKNDQGSPNGWVLSGNNTYTGTTTVNAGKLSITGTTSGQGNYSVTGNTGSALYGILGGNGTIGLAAGKNVTVNGATSELAQLAPTDSTGANSTIGNLTVNWASTNAGNAVTLGALSTYLVDVVGSSSSDELTVGTSSITGSFTLTSGVTLSLNTLTGAFDGSTYTIAHYFGTLTGTFTTLVLNGVTQGSASAFNAPYSNQTYDVVYGVADSGGYDIQLQAAPEPSTLAILTLGLGRDRGMGLAPRPESSSDGRSLTRPRRRLLQWIASSSEPPRFPLMN